jgi:hypothetical protein
LSESKDVIVREIEETSDSESPPFQEEKRKPPKVSMFVLFLLLNNFDIQIYNTGIIDRFA